jgi:hypothetical protein
MKEEHRGLKTLNQGIALLFALDGGGDILQKTVNYPAFLRPESNAQRQRERLALRREEGYLALLCPLLFHLF